MRELRRESIGKRFPWIDLEDIDPGKFRVRAVDNEILEKYPVDILGSLPSGYRKWETVNIRDRDGAVLVSVMSALESHDDANPSRAGEMVGEALARVDDLSKVAFMSRRVNAVGDDYYEDGPEWTVYKVRRFDLRKWLKKARRSVEIELDAQLLHSVLPGLDNSDLQFITEEARTEAACFESHGEADEAEKWQALAHASWECMTAAGREAAEGGQS